MASSTTSQATTSASSRRARVREVLPKLYLGDWPTGPHNSLTDVPGVLVHTQSIHDPAAGDVHTGVTTILPRKTWYKDNSYAGIFRFNGAGELTGSHCIEETGLLISPVVITNTFSVGDAYRGIFEYASRELSSGEGEVDWFILPVVGETFDGYLNNLSKFAVTSQHITEGIEKASPDPVPEGNTGGGTGMICHRYKGGTGSSSRVVQGLDADGNPKEYTLGVLVQANYGLPKQLHFGGVPVGRIMATDAARKKQEGLAESESTKTKGRGNPEEMEESKARKDGSIIVVIATDAPLHPGQLKRLAKRATVGLSRVGGYGHTTSGDIFLAFSTASIIPGPRLSMKPNEPAVDPWKPRALRIEALDEITINALIEAASDATEESIYNALCMAETTVGFLGRNVEELDLDALKEIMARYLQ
jgi:D-aminopeptidase